MHSAVLQFRENLARVRALGGLYEALCHLITPAIEATDLLRAQVVMGVSALDHYIHEITRLGMLEVLNGSRPRTNAFLRFQVTMDAAMAGLSGGGGISWFEDEIRVKHGYLAFQHPDTIADAIHLFSSCELWPLVCTKLGLTVQDVKTQLRLIVERRNKIVHEADLDPSYPGTRWPIDPVMVAETVDFIEKLCEAIHSTVV